MNPRKTGRAFEVAAKLRQKRGRVALISGRESEGLGVLSLVTAEPSFVVRGANGRLWCEDGQGRLVAEDDGKAPYAFIEERVRIASEGCATSPLAVGYLGYDFGAELAGVPRKGPEAELVEPAIDDVWFGIYRAWWLESHAGSTGHGVRGCSADDVQTFSRLLDKEASLGDPPRIGALNSNAKTDATYRDGFFRVRDYLLAGDCYQVNLSRRLCARVEHRGDPLVLLQQLCNSKPEPYAAMVETTNGVVFSGSPERFVHVDPSNGRIETRPIKGTRARTGDPDADRAARQVLANSEKERAEHLMIVDLERNDLGRVAVTGSVSVEEFARIVELPTLFHMVSTVSANLRPNAGLEEILAATFPGGSITGAPKRRAMEIIAELEPQPRGVYTGSIGTIRLGVGPWPEIDMAIAIRTAVLTASELSLHVGGGLVIDSECEREFAETEEKAAGWRQVLAALSVESA